MKGIGKFDRKKKQKYTTNYSPLIVFRPGDEQLIEADSADCNAPQESIEKFCRAVQPKTAGYLDRTHTEGPRKGG